MLFRGVFLLCLVCTMLLIGIGSHSAPGAWFEDIDDSVDIVFPERLNKGRLRRDLSTKSKNSSDEYVSFKLKAFGKDVVVDIHLNKMLATPQFTLRYFKRNGELVQREEATPKCQYQGYVRGQETESAVILETCHGLSGLIEDEENRLYIEPYPVKGKGAHKVYKTKNGKWKQFSCGTRPGKSEALALKLNSSSKWTSRIKREAGVTEYKKYLTTRKTRYTELMLIVDSEVYKKYKKDINDVKRRVFTLVNAVDAIYSKINIRVALSALEIWTDTDHVPFVSKAGTDLDNFKNHHSSNLAGVKYDSIHLLRGKMWDDYGGMAYKGSICGRTSLGVDAWNYWGSLGPWLALSHELGHNFNFDHDDIWPTCKCLSPRGCIMGSFKTRVPGFSDCNLHNMSSIDDSCLYNFPRKVVNSQCGNGIREPGEVCDCGTTEECTVRDPCCEPNDCSLKSSSQCSDVIHSCCQKCQFSPLGTLCRNSTGECDVPEVCDGKSAQCPSDDHMKDGTSCQGEGELLVGKYMGSVKKAILPQPITARHIRINPQFWEGDLCTKIDLLGCRADSSASSSTPTPIQGFGGLCVLPQGWASCPSPDGTELIFTSPGRCGGEGSQFTLSNGILMHKCSKKRVCPKGGRNYYGVPLVIDSSCDVTESKFERTQERSLRHVSSRLCVHPLNGVAMEGVKLVLWKGCEKEGLGLHFVAHDCLSSLGVADRQVIPDDRITASSHRPGYPAKEARLHSFKGWCAARKDQKQFIQIDLAQVKNVSTIVQTGTDYGDVTAFFLYYSQDGQRWKVWSSKPLAPAICFTGGCSSSLDSQCRDLWGPEALSAPTACYNELNRNGLGFGTCSSRGNVPCGKSHTKCGQLQCYTSARDWPVVDYGNYYELKVLASGDRCRAVSRKTSGGNVGMVNEGTVCKNNKICVANKCTGVKQSSSNDCPRTPDGKECGGKGVCTNRGKCYCQGNLDSETFCRSEKQARDGGWGAWSKWTNCTRVCGKGTKTRHRFCNNPAPVYDGQPCAGGRIQTVACNIKTCPVIHSCRHLLSLGRETGVQFPDGVYTINPDGKGPVNTYCDMTRDGGGWTLLVTSHTNTWTANNVKERNTKQPTLNGDFSILNKADDIKKTLMAEGDWFEYRIEANERGRWGGIWRAPRDYTFVAVNNKQTNVKLLKRFDNWKYDDYGIEKRMPWISGAKLTTSRNATGDRQWGTLIGNSKLFFPAPWLDGKDLEQHPVNIWYWIREPSYKPPKSCLDVQLRILANNKLLQDGIYKITLGNRDIQTHCKFSAYGGGWTLLLTSASDNGWTRDNLKSRNMGTPAMTLDFSILEMADKITNTKHFQYLIEEDSVKTWKGVWATKAGCALVSARSNKTCTKLVHRQGNWDSVRAKSFTRLPYLTTLGSTALLSSASDENSLNGAIVIDSAKRVQRQRAGVIRLWLREGTWRSCNELKTKKRGRGAPLKDGLYMIHQNSQYFPVYCDMTSETGAYTLLVTSSTNGWSKSKVNFKNPSRPSLVRDYSILGLADKIKALCGGTSFKYRLEANERGRWGGVWTAPISYSFVSQHNRQTNVTLVKKFDDWEYDWRDSLERRMPWLGERKGLLTTSTHADYSNWGSIISETKEYNPAPWIYYKMANPGVIWYWVNEDDNCNYDSRMPPAAESPIRSYGELCLQPQSGNCSPPDNTPLVYVQNTPECSKDYMMFSYEDGVLTHKCSRKKVCPNGEIPTWFTPLVVSSTCNEAASKFKWTFHQTFKHSSGFCVHPMSGTPLNGTTAILYKDACDEGRLKLDLFKLPVYQSPIRALGEFCLVPESASCDPPDNTRLVYRKEAECTASFMYFTYKGGVLTHSCSGKRVCPQGGKVGWGTPLVVSGTCPPKASVFHRTPNKTLRPNAAKYCVHPYGGPPVEGLHVITWKDENCNEKRLQLDFYKLRGPT